MNAPLSKLSTSACLLCLALLTACGNNDPNNNGSNNSTAGDMGADMTTRCVPNERFNPDTGRCEPIFEPTDMGGDMTQPPADMGDMSQPPVDMGPDMSIDPACDKDRDGFLSFDCDGNDCDDNDPERRPGAFEICDDKDNDCDLEVNEGIVCQFYAHTADTLYLVDPFKKRAQIVEQDIPRFLDIDTNPRTGELYGVTGEELWIYKEVVTGGIVRMEWQSVGDLGVAAIRNANGFAIDRDGSTAFVTASDQLYQVNLQTGRASLMTSLDNRANSSGDCVINKGNTLFMSSKEEGMNDRLLQLDGDQGTATNIGSMGGYTNHKNIYGLTFAWNRLWGLTVYGELIEIDASTAQSRLVTKFENVGFYGAASTPSR